MPTPTLSVELREFDGDVARLRSLLPSLSALTPSHRKLVAEIMMIRLFLLVENTVAAAAKKILCGASYLDGTAPQCLIVGRSLKAAADLMKTHGSIRQKDARA